MRKTCAEYNRVYRERHPERRRESYKSYLERHPERRKASLEKYRMNNRDKVRLASRTWSKKNYELNGRATTNEWESKNKEIVKIKKRHWHLKISYDLSEKDFLSLLHKQDNTCPICKTQFVKTPCVDHDHSTGEVRGLLCRLCNTALGIFKDNPDILRNAISYLCKQM